MTCDLHTHSRFSFDGEIPMEEMHRAAAEHGIDILAVTDHCDMMPGADGIENYLAGEEERLAALEQIRKSGEGPELLRAVEIGNPMNMPERTEQFLKEREFDFVLGAVHFLRDGSDVYYVNYRNEQVIDRMFREYFALVRELVEMGGFDSLAHLDYPVRVLDGKISDTSVRRYQELIEPVLEGLVRQQIALELNTQGTYDWQHRVGPEDWVLARYRELGGTYITIGSDSHVTECVGAGFAEAAEALKRNGFREYTVYRNRKPCQIPL